MSRQKKATKKGQDPNSLRTQKRFNRGFKSLEQSSRKHRRALDRLMRSRTIGANALGSNGTQYESGTAVDPPLNGKTKTFAQRAGGAYNYH